MLKRLGKYSLGIGDRFGQQGIAQLSAITEAARYGIDITPVWNKSNREHRIIGTEPADTRRNADKAVKESGFRKPYFVDADHISSESVEKFIVSSDYFTIDVADFIGKQAVNEKAVSFTDIAAKYIGKLCIPGIPKPFSITRDYIEGMAGRYLHAISMAAQIYRKIEKAKGNGRFITEISMDEVLQPQKPVDLFFILLMLSLEKVPADTIAPKFSGRFNKGVDYTGNISLFALEFESDLLVLSYAKKEFGHKKDLKISVHSGSDKFSIYPSIGRIIRKHKSGIHIKTSGTTWLEEVTGLTLSGSEGFSIVKEIYAESLIRSQELCAPYTGVIDIHFDKLPSADEVSAWSPEKFASSLRHDPMNPDYNPSLRQLMHVSYGLAAERKSHYLYLLEKNREIVSRNVFENLYKRHICKIFDIR